MATCPNKNLQSWKDLVSSRGEAIAYYLWDKYKGEVPLREYFPEIDPNVIDSFKRKMEGIDVNLYSQYLQQNSNSTIEGFKSWVNNKLQLQKDRKDGLRVANLEYLEEVLNTLSNKFGLPYEIIFDENNPNKGYVDVVSYKQPTIVINASKATNDTPLHEYGHIFINLIISSNKNLYSSLIKEVLSTEQGKKELKAVQEHYVNYTLEEQIEETIVQLLGEYAAGNLDPKTGLHKTIKKIWDSILEFLSKAFNVEIKDISPNTSLESLAKLLANPNINFNQKSFIERNIKDIKEKNLRDKKRLEEAYSNFKKIKDPSIIKEDNITLVVNEKEYRVFEEELESLINSLKSYSKEQLHTDIKNIKSQIETFEQRENFNHDRYPLFSKILSFIHPNKGTALWILNNADNLENKVKEILTRLDRPLNEIKKDIFSGYSIGKSLGINIPNFYKLSYKNNDINSVQDIEDGFKNKLSELNDIVKNPEKGESYYNRTMKVQIGDDNYSITGKFSNGNITISFSSDKYGMKDVNKGLFFKVLPKVIDSISYMFSDLEYNTISFTPVYGESSKGRDLRLKGYNIFAKRLFGQFSLVAENENTTIIPIPDAFKNRVHIKENMYQVDRDNASDNSFQQFQQSLNNPNNNQSNSQIINDQKTFDEMEKVSNMIMNKILTKEGRFYKKNGIKAKEDFFYNSEKQIRIETEREVITNIFKYFNSLEKINKLSDSELLQYLKDKMQELEKIKNEVYEKIKNELEELYSIRRTIQSFSKVNSKEELSKYSEEQQNIIKEYFSKLFEDNNYKTEKQALHHQSQLTLKKINKKINFHLNNKSFLGINSIIKKLKVASDFVEIIPNWRQLLEDKIENEYQRRLEYKIKNLENNPELQKTISFRKLWQQASFFNQEMQFEKKFKFLTAHKKRIKSLFKDYDSSKEIMASTNSVEILTTIANSDSEYKDLAKSLINFAKKNNVEIVVLNTVDEGVAGRYTAKIRSIKNSKGEHVASFVKNQIITLDGTSKRFAVNPEQLVLHEIVHSLSTIMIASESYEKEGKSIFDKYLDYLKKESIKLRDSSGAFLDFNSPYGFTNPQELFSETLTNPEFREMLKLIPPTESKHYTNFLEEFLDKVIKFISKIFKKDSNYENALEQLEDLIYDTFEAQSNMPLDLESVLNSLEGDINDYKIITSKITNNQSNVRYQKQTDLQAEQDSVLEEFANSLSERFNISFDLVSEEEARAMFPKYANEPAFFDPKTKQAYLVKGKANKTSAIHEIFTHPFLLQIEKTNPTLYKNLLKEAKNNKSVVDYVDNLYGTNQNNDHEYIARAIDLAVQGELDQQKDKTLLERIQDFFNQLSDYLKKLFNIPEVFSSAISPNITLQQLAQFAMYGKGKMNLNPAQKNIEYSLKATDVIVKNLDKIKQWEKNKSISEDVLWKKIQELGLPKEQIELVKNSEGNTVEEKLLDFVNQYSFTIEINTAKRENTNKPTQYYSNLTVPGGTNYTENKISTPLITPSIKGHAEFSTEQGIGWFRSDDKRSLNINIDINTLKESRKNPYSARDKKDFSKFAIYDDVLTKNVLVSGLTQEEAYKILDSIKNGNGILNEDNSKTRRILEVQSDLFQKGRGKTLLIDSPIQRSENTEFGENRYIDQEENGNYVIVTNYIDRQEISNEFSSIEEAQEELNKLTNQQGKEVQSSTANQFLQLLNKNNNWVTFFIKSIIQDSAKKGYEKVLFPSGNTASKVEGHTTLEKFKKQKEDRIKELEDFISNPTYDKIQVRSLDTQENQIEENLKSAKREINQLKEELERVEREGFGALKPIYNFYENIVTNILINDIYGKESEFVNYEFTFNNDKYERLNDKNQYLKNGKEITQKEFNRVQNSVTKQDKKEGKFTDKYYVNSNALITDEYGNTWNEITIDENRDNQNILFQKTPQSNSFQQFQQSLNNPNTNPILRGNQTNIEEIISQLEKDGLLEIDCKGKLKAEKGLATSFTKGSQWEIVKDLKGYPSHAQGGVDIKLGKNGFSFTRGNVQILAAHGLVLPKIR